MTLAEPFAAAGFRSNGPLSLDLRVGGSISLPAAKGQGGSLNLSGKAATQNLSPQQANLSYKLSGALSAPALKLQAKTDAKDNPLLVSLNTTLKEGSLPLSASLSWYGTQADYSGSLDPSKRTLEAS